MGFDPKSTSLSNYRPGAIGMRCLRCNRAAVLDLWKMRQKFGDITLHELVLQVAAQKGCMLAKGPERLCNVGAYEVSVEYWASLEDAHNGGWGALLFCERQMAAMKPTRSCPEPVQLDLLTLIGMLGGDFKLSRLPAKFKCPRCSTELVSIEWHVPKEPPSSGGAAARPDNVLRLRPGRVALAKQRFRAIDGGKG